MPFLHKIYSITLVKQNYFKIPAEQNKKSSDPGKEQKRKKLGATGPHIMLARKESTIFMLDFELLVMPSVDAHKTTVHKNNKKHQSTNYAHNGVKSFLCLVRARLH